VAATAASGRGEAASYSTHSATVPRGYCSCESGRVPAARVSPGSLRKPETIICFCLIYQIESYKYLYVSLIAIIIK
jgi:hypothetical protein